MRPALRCLLLTLLALQPLARAGAGPSEAPDLLLEVRVGQHKVSDTTGAFQHGNEIYLPLGELARLLTIALRSDPAARQASGYILSEQRGFRLDLARREVLREGRSEALDPAMVLARGDDLYVASRLLAQWLPVALEVDLPNMVLRVTPREKLPLQARLERQAALRDSGQGQDERHFPRQALPYALADTPFIDQTVTADYARRQGRTRTSAGYAAFVTGDLLGMEAALYLSRGQHAAAPAARLTLGRSDPDAGLLGPLRARSIYAGSVSAPGLQHIAFGGIPGNGVLLSNRPLTQPSHFDRHSFHGDLAPGWDVELYYNDALVATAQAGADGQYRFDDQALSYGQNEFRLVFHGPLGQLRVERHSFLLEQNLVLPGALHYSASARRDQAGRLRSQVQFDVGLGPHLSGTMALASQPAPGGKRSYLSAGVHGYGYGVIASATLVRSSADGQLLQLGVKTRLGRVRVGASRAWSDAFASELFPAGSEQLRLRDEISLDGVAGSGLGLALPVALWARRDQLATGQEKIDLSARISAYRHGTAFSQGLRWQSHNGERHADAVSQLSRRMAGFGLSALLQYRLAPQVTLSSLALTGEGHLAGGYLLNAGLARSFDDPQWRVHAGVARSMGRIGYSLGSWYSRREGIGLGVQLFLALGRDPRRGRWMLDAAPMAASGSASLNVFLDKNRNGIHDGADEAVPGAGFLLNGQGAMARTDAQGMAWIDRLAPGQGHDIAIDPATLEDPRWQARQPGVRVVARAGKTGQIDFAIGITGEIDGTTFLESGGLRQAIGDVDLELVDSGGNVVAASTSSADGYYVMTGVSPGAYTLRLSPAQLKRLGMTAPAPLAVTMDEDGNFLYGKDFVVRKAGQPGVP